MRIRAFQGLVPGPSHAAEVAAVPYDVVDRAEARALAADHPHNLLHVDRAEIDLPDEVDPYDDAVYAKALENFRRMQDEEVLVREPAPCLYLYRQEMDGHVQTGVAAVCHIDDYADDIIRKHEKTRPVKENDRTRLVDTLGADTGPIFLTYRDHGSIDALVDAFTRNEPPVWDVTAADGVRHQVWRILNTEPFSDAFANVDLAYVADGHHRSASAFRVGAERRARNPSHDGSEDYNWFLSVLFPASQLKILGYHRVVADLNGFTEADFLDAVRARFQVAEAAAPEPSGPADVRMYLGGGRWFALSWQPDPLADPVAALDVSVLQRDLLEPVLGIDDPRTNERIDFVGGVRGTGELERRVDSGEAAVAFAMFPVTVGQLMDIANAGQIMPPKSTWFEPKLRSGFFIHTLD